MSTKHLVHKQQSQKHEFQTLISSIYRRLPNRQRHRPQESIQVELHELAAVLPKRSLFRQKVLNRDLLTNQVPKGSLKA